MVYLILGMTLVRTWLRLKLVMSMVMKAFGQILSMW